MNDSKPPRSPLWSVSSKRTVVIIVLVLALLLFYRVNIVLLPLSLATILAYLITPLVNLITRTLRLPRLLVIATIYLALAVFIISIPVIAIPPLVNQINVLVSNVPRYLAGVGNFFDDPIVLVEGYEIPIDELPFDQIIRSLSENLVGIVQTLGGQTLAIFSSVATVTISTVGWLILIMIISFYMVKDHERLFETVLNLTPADYRSDVRQLGEQISLTWNAFLRGQLVLCFVVGIIVYIAASILGLPNAGTLAIFAGFMELIPTFGPVLAAIPAIFLAVFQTESSWLGSFMSPFWFAVLVAGIYALIYQFENYVLVPRIIGYHLKLHPLVVLVGVIGGAAIAGVLGILLAAPVLASARIILRYIYSKLLDQPPFAQGHEVLNPVDTAVLPKLPLPLEKRLERAENEKSSVEMEKK
ncbi:MAG: AI-2E family transporter [Anaerolineae bacterium]|nr:AI-2E family transporter [Anaerolineae bacterium]